MMFAHFLKGFYLIFRILGGNEALKVQEDLRAVTRTSSRILKTT